MASNEQPPTLFESSVETAVARSVQERIPLVVFVADQSPESQRWATDLLGDDEVSNVLRGRSVALRLKNESDEAKYFAQIFPIVNIPSLYIISNGSMVDYISGSIDIETCVSRLRNALGSSVNEVPTSPQSHSTLVSQSSDIGTASTTTAPSPNPSSSHVSSVPLDSAPTSSTIPLPRSADVHLDHSRDQIQDQVTIEKDEKRESHTISHIETGPTNNKYQEELRRKRIQDSEERQRILRLVQADKDERRANSRPVTASPNLEGQQHKRTSSGVHNYTDSALAIRLFDGSSIKTRFQLQATLGDVRTWIDSMRTDGDAPYSILSLFPHKIFSPSDESKTLVELELHPTATLILKPINNYTSAYSPTTAVGRVQSGLYSGFSWAWGAVGTFLGLGQVAPATPTDEQEVNSLPERRRTYSSSEHGTAVAGQRPRTIQDLRNAERDRRTYNGNQLNLEEDSS